MISPFTEALVAFQTRPANPLPLHQTAEWEQQSATAFPRRIVYVPGGRRLGASIHPQAESYEQARPNRDLAGQLRALQQHYTVLDSDRVVIEFLEEQAALFTLLLEAVRPLQTAFGERRLLHVRMQHSDDDSLLKVAVQLPADFVGAQAEQALRSFDGEWWLKNCHRSGGALVFDYEIQDAV